MLDTQSSMTDTTSTTLNARIADRVRELRAARGLSLDALATRSGVSRSMISVIERGESSPTAVVLEKLSVGLGVPLASLFDAPADDDALPAGPVARRADQPEWRDPASGYLRRNVSPAGVGAALPDRRGRVSPARARRLRDRRARRARRPAGVGARGVHRHHLGRRALPPPRRRLPRHAARSPDHVPQSDAKARALRGRPRVRAPAETMTTTRSRPSPCVA